MECLHGGESDTGLGEGALKGSLLYTCMCVQKHSPCKAKFPLAWIARLSVV